MSGRDNLIFYGKLLGLSIQEINENIDKLSREFYVNDIINVPFMKLSLGQMQIFNIMRALLKEPDYIFLDEPSTGLDLEKSIGILSFLKNYISDRKIPAIWCSHNLDEIDNLCTRFAILSDKRFKVLDKEDFMRIKNQTNNYYFQISKSDLRKLDTENEIEVISESDRTSLIRFDSEKSTLNELINFFLTKDIELISIENNKNMKGFKFDKFFK